MPELPSRLDVAGESEQPLWRGEEEGAADDREIERDEEVGAEGRGEVEGEEAGEEGEKWRGGGEEVVTDADGGEAESWEVVVSINLTVQRG